MATSHPRHARRKRPRRQDGLRVAVEIVESVGGKSDAARRGWNSPRLDAHRRPKRRTGTRPVLSPEVCAATGALAHPARGRILLKLLEGPATYRALQRTTKLKAGPLYHHINHLRIAGLILPKQRDLYELTRGGRNLILVGTVLDGLVQDRRPRPIASPVVRSSARRPARNGR